MEQLGQYIDIILGGTPNTSKNEYWGGDIPWASVVDFKESKFLFSTEKSITQFGLENSNTKLLSIGDIIVSARGTVGKLVVCKVETAFNQSCYAIRTKNPKQLDQNYLYYLLRYKILELKTIATGGVFDTIVKTTLENLKFQKIDIFKQQRIASILSVYDDLIEVNNERIKILEETAKELYKEWFVRMRFPGYKNAKFNKGVPEKLGSIKYFRDFIKLNRGFDLPSDKIVEGVHPIIASTSVKAYHNAFKVKPPVITTGRSGSLGTVLYVNQNAWPLNTALYVKDFKGNQPLFVYFLLSNMNLENFDSGAGVPTLNQNHLHKLKLWVPCVELQSKFAEIVSPLFQQIENLRNQNAELAQIRDRLLPRLISGKLELKTVEKNRNLTKAKLKPEPVH
jgi:type I restriction enzyme, S subunit